MQTISTNNKTNESIPWVEKYRPNDLSELIGHEHTVSTSKAYILHKSNFFSQNLHLEELSSKSSFLWASRDRQDLHYDSLR